MALISCPECGKKISDKAKKCPNCGYHPISEDGAKDLAFIKAEDGQHKDEPQNAMEKWRIVMVAVAGVIALCCIGVCIASYSLHKSEGGDSVSKEAVAARNDGKDEDTRTETSKPEKQGAALWEGYAAAHYKRGKEHLVHGSYEKAFIDYKKAEGLQDAGEQAALCAYKSGQSAMKEKKYVAAAQAFEDAAAYKMDNKNLAYCRYMGIVELLEEKKYIQANILMQKLKDQEGGMDELGERAKVELHACETIMTSQELLNWPNTDYVNAFRNNRYDVDACRNFFYDVGGSYAKEYYDLLGQYYEEEWQGEYREIEGDYVLTIKPDMDANLTRKYEVSLKAPKNSEQESVIIIPFQDCKESMEADVPEEESRWVLQKDADKIYLLRFETQGEKEEEIAQILAFNKNK